MNYQTIRTQDSQNLIEKMNTANVNDVKTLLVNNWDSNGSMTKCVKGQIAFNELKRRGISFQYTKNCFNFFNR